MSLEIGGTEIAANEVNVTVTGSIEVESHQWLLRDGALNSRSTTGHKSIEVETLSGVRVLMQADTGTYHDVPKNNDDAILSYAFIYEVTIMTVSAIGADIDNASGLADKYATSMEYYGERRNILARINDPNISYDKKKDLLDELNQLDAAGTVTCSIPGFSITNGQFAESGGLNVSSWTNGPYCDLKAIVVSRKKITLS